MWTHSTETSDDDRAHKISVRRDGDPVAYANVLSLWQDNAAFRRYFISLLADSPFSAFRWETPPITAATAGCDFECVLLRYEALNRPVDRAAFSGHFDDGDIVTFQNLGRDAVLVVPCPSGDETVYGHLASFSRGASESQQHELWKAVGSALQKNPVWLSTAGMGVAWLHVRLDARPKYYGYGPYKIPPQ